MNKEIMKQLGFTEELKQIEKNNCPFCRKPIKEQRFRDTLSEKEHKISGLCQHCQDKVYGMDEEENPEITESQELFLMTARAKEKLYV